MKNVFTIIAVVLFTTTLWAQSPEKISYQAIVRDASNNLVTNTIVGMRIQIIQTSEFGAAVYVETQTPTANANGLISLEIGSGTIVSGTFSAIDWGSDNYYIKTEIDPEGGTNYIISGTSQLLSVPYALHAKSISSNLLSDTSTTNELQTLSVNSNQLSISNGNTVELPVSSVSFIDSVLFYSENGALWSMRINNYGELVTTQYAHNGFFIFNGNLGGVSSMIGSQFSSLTGQVFTMGESETNSGIIDIIYQSTTASIIAPDASGYVWSTLNATRFKSTTITPNEFDNISDVGEINIAASGASENSILNISIGDVIAFVSPVNNKSGLIMITGLITGDLGYVTIIVKVAE